jgi:redox-sensitive bicupin YhaK (pirin superfamily)
MLGTSFRTEHTTPPDPYSLVTAKPGRIALLANGRRQGPITRFITPWDIGELTRPFLLLNYAEVTQRSRPLFAIYPPSGAMALTIVLEGELSFEDERGRRGEVGTDGAAWMKAGSVVWHDGGPPLRDPLRLFHLWIARPTAQHGSVAASEHIAADGVEEDGPVRVFLGQFGRARSRLQHAPADVNCFHVRLRNSQQFRYAVPEGHDVIVLTVDRGGLQLPAGERILWEQSALFGPGSNSIEVRADGETSFLLASTKRLASVRP